MSNSRLKFRQWSERFNRFYYWGLGIDAQGGGDTEASWSGPVRHAFVDDIEKSEQWTGLQDKNGVDIWEGDIVEKTGDNLRDQFNPGFSEKHKAKIGDKYVVVGLKSGSTLVPIFLYNHLNGTNIAPNSGGNIGQYNFWNGAATACEVIGNIHQHPELIK